MLGFKGILLAVLSLCLMAPSSVMAATKDGFAVVDVEVLMNESAAGKSIQEQLKLKQDAFQKEFSKKEEELHADQKKIVEKKAEMKPEELNTKRQEFEAKLLETRKLLQKRRSSLDSGLGKAMQELRKNIMEVSAEIAEAKGYSLVLSRDSIVVAQKEADITKEALEKLNSKVKSITLKVE